jgi:hypothetical protein
VYKLTKIKDVHKVELVVENILLLTPGTGYWISAVMSAGLGGDYFYDVMFAQLKVDLIGKMFLGMLILIFPVVSLVINLLMYKNKKREWLKWYMALGGILTLAGALALGGLLFAA